MEMERRNFFLSANGKNFHSGLFELYGFFSFSKAWFPNIYKFRRGEKLFYANIIVGSRALPELETFPAPSRPAALCEVFITKPSFYL